MNVKSYDLCLVVDLDGVGQAGRQSARAECSEELASIPIQARCGVPQVALEPAEHVEYGGFGLLLSCVLSFFFFSLYN